MTKQVENVFVVKHYSEYTENGVERIYIEGFSGILIDEGKLIEKQSHSWDWKSKNKKALLAKIRREFGMMIK